MTLQGGAGDSRTTPSPGKCPPGPRTMHRSSPQGLRTPGKAVGECQGLVDREPRLRESCIRDGHLGKAGDRSQGPSRSWLAVNRKLCFLGPQLTPLPTSLTCLGTPALGQSLETGAF